MSVSETGVVDVVVMANHEGATELVIFDQLPWKIDEGDHLIALQDKFNAYLGYVQCGQLYEEFPTTKGRKLILRINGLYPPSPNGEKFLAAIRPVARQLDIDLVFDLTTPDKRPPGFTPQEF